jgi:NADH-quinone oxidoreductase subunit J
MESIIFWSLSGLIVLFAVLVISAKNPVHSAIFLVGALLLTAGLYILLDAEFVVGVQVIVYVGGITVLYLFVISLIVLKRIPLESSVNRQWPAAIIAAVAVMAEVAFFLLQGDAFFKAFEGRKLAYGTGQTEAIGKALYGPYVFPFEVATVLLLVAIIGAVLMSRKPERDSSPES